MSTLSYTKKVLLYENSYFRARLYAKESKKKKKIWVQDLYKNRSKLGEYHYLIPQLHKDEERFHQYFQMSSATYDELLSLIGEGIEKKTTNLRTPISAEERLVVTLRYLTTGMSYRSVSLAFRIGKSTVSKIIKESCSVIEEKVRPLYMPSPDETLCNQITEDFASIWNFPNCFGCLGSMYVKVQCSEKSEANICSYKHIALQSLVDANCKFITIDTEAKGKESDGEVMRESGVFAKLVSNAFNSPAEKELPKSNIKLPLVILGNETHPLLSYLMRPYSDSELTDQERVFNCRLSRARRCADCALGIMSSKFKVLRKPIKTSLETAEAIVKTVCILHNMILQREAIGSNSESELEKFVSAHQNTNCSNHYTHETDSSRYALQVRQSFLEYFDSPEGTV